MSENLTPYQQWKKNLGDTRPWDMINPAIEKVPKEVAQERYDICKECPFLLPTTQCNQCGCFMKAKVKLPMAACPEHKWEVYNPSSDQ
jgi:hypothetical protein